MCVNRVRPLWHSSGDTVTSHNPRRQKGGSARFAYDEILGTSPAKGPKNKGFLGAVPTRSPWRSCCRAGDGRWKNELTWLRRFRMS